MKSVTDKNLLFHRQIRVLSMVTEELGTTNTQEPTNIFQFIGRYSSSELLDTSTTGFTIQEKVWNRVQI